MSFVSAVAVLAAEGGNHQLEAMGQTFWVGLVCLAVFALLGFVTFSFRNVANRHSAKAQAYAKAHQAELSEQGHGH